MARSQRKTKKRERTLGQAIGLGLAVTLGVACVLYVILWMIPASNLANFYALSAHASSPTIRVSALFQQWATTIQWEEKLIVSPISLLCGGLILGRFAPRYATTKRVLLSSAKMAFALISFAVIFDWTDAFVQDWLIDRRIGGFNNPLTAPPDVILGQIGWVLVWITVCILGTWGGLRWRDRTKIAPHSPLLREQKGRRRTAAKVPGSPRIGG